MTASKPVLRTVYRDSDVVRARENLRRHAWAQNLIGRLRSEVAATVAGGASRIDEFITTTTPGAVLFTNCPRCLGNAIHGAYDWDPADPDVLVCTTCGAQYPDPEFGEDVVFRPGGAAAGQEIAYHGDFGHPFNGFVLHSSWSSAIRGRKVAHMIEQLRRLAILYAVTGEEGIGDTAAAILVRFARVYPGYLVHSGYGEWTDLPPRIAATRLTTLPQDEWTVAPNVADRRLHAGYWMAGRATSGGQEGGFVQTAAIAYDLVRDRLGAGDRLLVETDLLRESLPLLLADPAMNNKSISNAIGAGMVGLVLDEPELVRFGSRAFWHFVRRWFLPDGGTPESPGYAHMALHSMIGFGDALHGRERPDGTVIDVYGDPGLARIHRNGYDTLLPDLRHPAFADSYTTTTLDLRHADLLVSRYPRPEYRALLRAVRERPASLDDEIYALFHRDPGMDEPTVDRRDERIVLPDVLLPWLRIGYLRAGADGRDATVLLSASHWGVHHHRDSLNLTYWDRGHHALDDLGYLWDRTDRDATVRTAAHNLVVVDGAEQRTEGRGGTVELFDRVPDLAIIAASSTAYPQTSAYRRTCVLVSHGPTDRYLVDLFAVTGGHRHDHVLHGPVPAVDLAGVDLRADASGPGYEIVAARRSGALDSRTWRADFALDTATVFSTWGVSEDEELWVGDGWGERGVGHVQVEAGRTVPYLVRRREAEPAGEELDSLFVSVHEVHGSRPVVQGVRAHRVGSDVVVEVATRDGHDLVALRRGTGRDRAEDLVVDTGAGLLRTDAVLTVFGAGSLYLADGTHVSVAGHQVQLPAARSGGRVVQTVTSDTESVLVVRSGDLATSAPAPSTVHVDDGIEELCLPVLEIRHEGDQVHLVTGRDTAGSPLPAGGGLRWTVVHSASHRGPA